MKILYPLRFGNGNWWTRKQPSAYLSALWEAAHKLPLIIKVDDSLMLVYRRWIMWKQSKLTLNGMQIPFYGTGRVYQRK